MKISVLYPSRNRPEQASKTQGEWIWRMYDNTYGEGAPTWDVEFITSLDIDDKSDYTNIIGTIIRNENRSAIDAINKAAEIATGDILMVISDDTWCFPAWDRALINLLQGKSDFCAKVDDGLQPTLITMPIMDRVYYERYGYIYNPAYQHMFVDQELTAVAIMTGKRIKLPLLFPHNHYSTGKTPKDALNSRNDATWQQGERLFNERLKTNFDIENPVIPYSEIKWR